jgi:hypothetical protein
MPGWGPLTTSQGRSETMGPRFSDCCPHLAPYACRGCYVLQHTRLRRRLAFIQISKAQAPTELHSLQLLGAPALLTIRSRISDVGSNPHFRNTKLGLYLAPYASRSVVLCICAWKSNVGKFQVQPETNKLLLSDQLSLLCGYSSRSCPRSVKSNFSAPLSKRSTTELVVICSSFCYSMQACGTLQPVCTTPITLPGISMHHSFFTFLFRHVC